jgi:hypothetical protein
MSEVKPKSLRNSKGAFVAKFTANGNKYTIRSAEDAITLARYQQYEVFNFNFRFDSTPENIAAVLADSSSLLNNILAGRETKRNAVHAITAMQDILEKYRTPSVLGMGRMRYIMLICSLFITTEGEDITKFSQSEADIKIQDWIAEGYGIADFFHLAMRFLDGLSNALQSDTEIG